jgi:hypothetical protein
MTDFYELDFRGIKVPMTNSARMLLWLLYNNPHKPYNVAAIFNVKRSAAINRIQRAAEALGDISPALAAALREHVHWSGGTARYVPVIRKM